MITYDLLIIGSGPAGQRAAIYANKLGKRAAVVERNRNVGGVSVNTGTIPSKTMREAVLHLSGYNYVDLWDELPGEGKDHDGGPCLPGAARDQDRDRCDRGAAFAQQHRDAGGRGQLRRLHPRAGDQRRRYPGVRGEEHDDRDRDQTGRLARGADQRPHDRQQRPGAGPADAAEDD